jgi:hypothetical protein
VSDLDRYFKWKPGDIVTLRAAGPFDILGAYSRKRGGMVIVQRLLAECPGGIQQLYEFSIVGDRGLLRAQFNEVELMDVPPPDETK